MRVKLRVGTRTTGVACVKTIAMRTTKTGVSYLDATIGHADGQTTVKVWCSDMPNWTTIPEISAVAVALVSKSGALEPKRAGVRKIRRKTVV